MITQLHGPHCAKSPDRKFMSKQRKQSAWSIRKRKSRPKNRFRPMIELLEDRCLLSAPVWPTWLPTAPATSAQIATLDAAATLNLTGDPQNASALLAANAQGA